MAKKSEKTDDDDDKKRDDEEEEEPKAEDEDEVKGEDSPKKEGEKEVADASPLEELIPEASIEITVDPKVKEQQALIQKSTPRTKLELALSEDLQRKESHIERLSAEVTKLKAFISKRKQTYKRKRKDEGAPTRALSAYNIFVKERFLRLSKENEAALKSADTDAVMKRVPPASLVASTGNQWKELTADDKRYYEEKAKTDRTRYEDQMAKYQPPEKQGSRKRNKTGYNMFFSAHVLRLKQTEAGVPSERGSVARLVGNAWKELSAEEKQYYEREADRENGLNPVEREEADEEGGKKSRARAPAAAPADARGEQPRAPVVHQPEHGADQHYPGYSQHMHPGGHPGYAQGQYPGYDYSQMQGAPYGQYYDQSRAQGYPPHGYGYPQYPDGSQGQG